MKSQNNLTNNHFNAPRDFDNRSTASNMNDNRSITSTAIDFSDKNFYGFDHELIESMHHLLRNLQNNRASFLSELLKLIYQASYNNVFIENLLDTTHFQKIITDISQLSTTSEEEQNNREKLNKTIEELSQKLETMNSELNQKLETMNSELNQRKQSTETILEEFKKRLESIENIVKSKEESASTISEHTKEIAGLSALVKQLQETIEKQAEKITILTVSNQNLEKQTNEERQKRLESKEETESTEHTKDIAELSALVKQLQETVEKQGRGITTLTISNQNLEIQINEERKKREVVEASLSQIISELSSEDFKNLLKTYKERVSLMTERLNNIENRTNANSENVDKNKKDNCAVM